MLVLIRDMGLPMPAGADLFSPWVDLSHSFPSVLKNAKTDFIPDSGFHYKPSLAWPPVKGTILSVESDTPGEPAVEIDEQIQLYCPNILLSHPLVSPVNQGSLGGLCPILVVSGSYTPAMFLS
jgi:acetyl esterase/lipase